MKNIRIDADGQGRALESLVSQLCSSVEGQSRWFPRVEKPSRLPLPAREEVDRVVEELRAVLFPDYFGPAQSVHESTPFNLGATLDRVAGLLHEQIARGLCFSCESHQGVCDLNECHARAREKTWAFLARLPEVGRLLATDVKAAFEGDPAAKSPDETIICYPGLLAVTNYRLAHELRRLEVPLIPRMITERAHSLTGIDIHPGARIDESFFIDHGTGVVVGETCVIGKRVRLYQGVTLGAKSFPLDGEGHPVKGIDRHPIVEDDVVIYSGATILGRVVIGKGSTIGGNVWLTHDVPAGTTVTIAPPTLRVSGVGDSSVSI